MLLLKNWDVLRIILQSDCDSLKQNQIKFWGFPTLLQSWPVSHLTFLFQFLPLISFYFLARFQSLSLSLSVTQSPQPESGGSAWGDVVCVTGCEMSVTLTGLSGYLTACRLIASSFRLNEGAGHKSFLCGCMVVFAVYIDLVKLKEYHTPQRSKRSSFSHPCCSKPVKCHW